MTLKQLIFPFMRANGHRIFDTYYYTTRVRVTLSGTFLILPILIQWPGFRLLPRAGSCTSALWLKVNFRLKVNCRMKFGPAQILSCNSPSVCNSLLATIHLYMIWPIRPESCKSELCQNYWKSFFTIIRQCKVNCKKYSQYCLQFDLSIFVTNSLLHDLAPNAYEFTF